MPSKTPRFALPKPLEGAAPLSEKITPDLAALSLALSVHSIIATTDRQGIILFANDPFCSISGYSREELLGQDQRLIYSDHHPSAFFEAIQQTVTSGQVWRGEMKNRAKDGTFFWVATMIVPIPGEGGQPERFISICADITEPKRVEEELADKLRMQRLLANLSERFQAVSSRDLDAVIQETQRTVVEAFGLDRSTLWEMDETRRGLVLSHGWQRPGLPEIPTRFDAGTHLPYSHLTVLRGECLQFSRLEDLPPEAAQDVEWFRRIGPASNFTVPLSAEGKVFGGLAFATLTREHVWKPSELEELRLVSQVIANALGRRKAELRAEQLRSELARASRVTMLGELAVALAHELNQPLASILTNAQVGQRLRAEGIVDTEEFDAILSDIVRDSKRAGGVIWNIRAMLDNEPSPRESCSINDLIVETAHALRAELVGHQCELILELEPTLPFPEVSRLEIQQVLANLFLNAAQAMGGIPSAKRIAVVRTSLADSQIRIAVRDAGPGIPPQLEDQLFAPFKTTKEGGMGMGLAICLRIVQSHGGSIRAVNCAEGGAEFEVTLPVARGDNKT